MTRCAGMEAVASTPVLLDRLWTQQAPLHRCLLFGVGCVYGTVLVNITVLLAGTALLHCCHGCVTLKCCLGLLLLAGTAPGT